MLYELVNAGIDVAKTSEFWDMVAAHEDEMIDENGQCVCGRSLDWNGSCSDMTCAENAICCDYCSAHMPSARRTESGYMCQACVSKNNEFDALDTGDSVDLLLDSDGLFS